MDESLKHVFDKLISLKLSEQGVVFKIDRKRCIGTIVGGFAKGKFVLPGKKVNLSTTPLEDIIKDKEAHIHPGTYAESLPFPTYKPTLSGFECLCIPLLNAARTVEGIIVLAQKTGLPQQEYRQRNLALWQAVADATMESNHLNQLATIDTMTGLYTRHYFEIRLQEEFTRARRHGGVIALLMIDIDHFKHINDTYGYQQGNKVLQETATIFKSSIRREIDIPCRYGGEEFAILLPNTTVDGAYILAERIRQRYEQHEFLQDDSIRSTVSIGIADSSGVVHGLDEEIDNPEDPALKVTEPQQVSKEELLHRADLMLYAAKQAGRNQVMVWW